MKFSFLFILWVAAGISPALGEGPAPEPIYRWKKCLASEGLTLFWSKVEGSDVIAFRAEGIVDAPIEKVASVVLDKNRGTEWVNSLLESKVVREISPTEFIEYDRMAAPPLSSERDFVSRVTLDSNPLERRITVRYRSQVDPLTPPLKRCVRGDVTCEFKMVPMTLGDQTYLQTQIFCDPKGGIPKWVVNFFQQGWPQTTFGNLRKQVKKDDIQVLPVVEKLLQVPPVKVAEKKESKPWQRRRGGKL
jgi:hypothetical protein